MVKLVDKIDLSSFTNVKNECKCDECNHIVNTSFGDPREEVFRFDSKDQKDPSSSRMVCPSCINDLFGHNEPYSIFG